MEDFPVRNFVMNSGERYCLLVDGSGVPLYFPNLFVTTQIRNKSLSISAMEAALGGIAVLLRFMKHKELESRFNNHSYLKLNEIEMLRDLCQKKFRIPSRKIVFLSEKKLQNCGEGVSKETEYSRLTSIAQYLEWLANTLGSSDKDRHITLQIQKMVNGIKAARPKKKNRNGNEESKALDKKEIELVFEFFRPDSELNPFKEDSVRIRNHLIFLMLYHLGVRAGELLNIRIRDLDFSRNELVIARRADERDDPRTYQPLVKTLDRRLPLKETLAKEIHNYIVKVRKHIPNANKHDFLFVTHKSHPTQGQPMSIVAYKKVIQTISSVAPDLHQLSGHKFRHTWNDNFSKHMDAKDQPLNEEKQEQIRSYLMGWRTGSGTATIYNKRFIKNKAHEAALSLQNDIMWSPKKEKNESNFE